MPDNDCDTKVTGLEKLHLKPFVSTNSTCETFKVLSAEVVMFILYKKTPIVTTLGFYNDAQLKQAGKECISNQGALTHYIDQGH